MPFNPETCLLANKRLAELRKQTIEEEHARFIRKRARAEAIAYAWEQGATTFQTIGRRLGISRSRMWQILQWRERCLRLETRRLVPLRALLEALADADQA
jgi:DNA-directed RNA polymerase sigma subunit (sigma70/sigma32)